MTEQRLNEHVKNHYAQQSLQPAKLEQLITQAETAPPLPDNALRVKRRAAGFAAWATARKSWMITAVAAIIAAAVPLTVWQATSNEDWSVRAAREIALNHKKQLSIEFHATDYAELRAVMNKLDFILTAPTRLPVEGLQVVGARYCSIQGHLAAQVRLRDRAGQVYTLYERTAHGVPTFAAQQEHVIDGVYIQEWQEAGLLFGLATSP